MSVRWAREKSDKATVMRDSILRGIDKRFCGCKLDVRMALMPGFQDALVRQQNILKREDE